MRTITEDLKTEYLLDSAVLIEMGGRKALIDGLPSDRNTFDVMPPELEEDIMAGKGDFEGLKDLFFTHCHGDHMSGRKLTAYLERNPDSFVAVPGNAEIDFGRFEEAGTGFFIPKGEKGQLRQAPAGTAALDFEYMRTAHLTFDYPEHYAYNFLEGDTNVIFTGDMDLIKLRMLSGFTMRRHPVIFLNSIILWHKRWCDIIDEMGFEKVFVYHVPSGERDIWGYREKALKHWLENGLHRSNWEILNL